MIVATVLSMRSATSPTAYRAAFVKRGFDENDKIVHTISNLWKIESASDDDVKACPGFDAFARKTKEGTMYPGITRNDCAPPSDGFRGIHIEATYSMAVTAPPVEAPPVASPVEASKPSKAK